MPFPPRSLPPKYGPQFYKTYQIVAPVATHFADATCAEVNCPNHLAGWSTTLDETNADHAWLARWIRTESGRRCTEERTGAGLTVFTFEAGQECFHRENGRRHKRRVDRPEHYLVRDGDYRGNPFGTRARMHTRAEFWQEDFAEHQDRLAQAQQRG